MWGQAQPRTRELASTPHLTTIRARTSPRGNQVRRRSPGTVDGYRREADRTFLRRLGRLPLDMITEDRVVDWLAWQRQQETARSTKARAKAIEAGHAPPPAQRVSDKTIANAHGLLSSVDQC